MRTGPAFKQNKQASNEYLKYRKRRYFKKFESVKHRPIWGCDSPIELFLLQAMDSIGLNPEPQMIICEDAFTAPNLHKLLEDDRLQKKMKKITDTDFYFHEEKLAVFCDSVTYHTSDRAPWQKTLK